MLSTNEYIQHVRVCITLLAAVVVGLQSTACGDNEFECFLCRNQEHQSMEVVFLCVFMTNVIYLYIFLTDLQLLFWFYYCNVKSGLLEPIIEIPELLWFLRLS